MRHFSAQDIERFTGQLGDTLVLKAFDPNQPRDEEGKWTETIDALYQSTLDKPLTEQEVDAVRTYTGEQAFKELQSYLRQGVLGGGPIRISQDIVDLKVGLDRALDKTSMKKDLVVYRGISNKTARIIEKGVGSVFEDRGFASSSPNRAVAQSFVDDVKLGAGRVLTIRVPRGARALPIGKALQPPGIVVEDEVLLPSNSRFKVIDKNTLELLS